jgi:dTDP-glucose 4,6-dehydratase
MELNTSMTKTIIVTGGAGFIGSAMVRYIINNTTHRVINIDKLTYAGHSESVETVSKDPRYHFEKIDIVNGTILKYIFRTHKPDAIIHLAAESHVDRSIDGPSIFLRTNIIGTYTLLETVRDYLNKVSVHKRDSFRFVHVSTDEVYGSLGKTGLFSESTSYQPQSPYSASKASSDHLARAWYHTYGVPTITTNCSNNYGPYQYPEKLIPVIILNALQGEPIPIYGKGDNVRDWLYVDDHVRALLTVLEKGRLGETYNIGGGAEMMNIQIVQIVCDILDESPPSQSKSKYKDLITFVKDRPGHDKRYAVDTKKIRSELGWEPQEKFQSGIRRTVEWYLDNLEWCKKVLKGKYNLERLGNSC